jgi:hypothetical protein
MCERRRSAPGKYSGKNNPRENFHAHLSTSGQSLISKNIPDAGKKSQYTSKKKKKNSSSGCLTDPGAPFQSHEHDKSYAFSVHLIRTSKHQYRILSIIIPLAYIAKKWCPFLKFF